MNKGKPFYLTGDNYFFLTHWVMDDGERPQFVINQAHDFYFEYHVASDTKCFGSLKLKPRREGCTNRTLARMLNLAITEENCLFGIQSKTEEDAQNVNFANLVNAFKKLPVFMRPQQAGMKDPKNQLEFAKPREMATKNNQGTILDKKYLNNIIGFKPTKAAAYDGTKLRYFIGDEVAKWLTADASKMWKIVKKCLAKGNSYRLHGKAALLSTITDEDGKLAQEAAKRFKELWEQSDPNNRLPNGFTHSGLYRWFIPVWASLLDEDPVSGKQFVNKYGEVDEEFAKYCLLRDRPTDREGLRVAKRQTPFTVDEALNFSTAGTVFDVVRLTERQKELNDFSPTPERPTKTRRGNFAWVNGERYGKVQFVDNPNGFWEIAYMPNIAGDDATNRVFREGILTRPYADSQFVAGIDSYDYDDRDEGDHSKGAVLIKLKENFRYRDLSNVYCAKFCHRLADSEAFYEEVIKACFYYGAKISLERNSPGLKKSFKQRGLLNWIMRRAAITKGSAFTDKDDDYGNPKSQQSTDLGCSLIETYIAPPDPNVNENLKDNLQFLWFDEVIEQLMNYTDKDKEHFDLVAAMIQTEIGCQSMRVAPKETTAANDNKEVVNAFFPKYNTARTY